MGKQQIESDWLCASLIQLPAYHNHAPHSIGLNLLNERKLIFALGELY